MTSGAEPIRVIQLGVINASRGFIFRVKFVETLTALAKNPLLLIAFEMTASLGEFAEKELLG